MLILGIETSCDETAAAVIEGNRGKINVLSNVVSSQIDLHKKYGGVVPEVAAREHVLNILPVVNEALGKANLTPALSFARRGSSGLPERVRLDAIAVTIGPGLITSLIVGIETAKILSYGWNIPVIGINHIEGHIYANFIGENSKSPSASWRTNLKQITNIKFPSIILTVSGGHTMLVLMTGHGKYKTIGQTRDDAAGEAFDKAAQLLGLGFPGGPEISKYANKYIKQNFQITNHPALPAVADSGAGKSQITNKFQIPKHKKISLPRPMIDSKNFDFSFSGLKTALLYAIKKDPNYPLRPPRCEAGRSSSEASQLRITNYCHEFQQAVIDVLISKTIKAAQKYQAKTLMLTGGVAANLELRKQLEKAVKKLSPAPYFLTPDLKYTTDNAAMIAAAGYYKALRKEYTPWNKLKVDCNLELN